jgi:choloylglycine hydrolase
VGQGDFTKWSIAYDISNKEIHFKTNKHNQRKLVRLAAFNFDCSQSLLSWNMNQPGQSDVSAKFQKSSYKENEELIRRSVLETGSRLRVSEADIEQTAQLYRFSECLKADGTVSKSQLGNIDFLAKNILWILAIGLVALLLKPLILTRNKA